MLYSNVWNRYSALLDYHYYYIIYHNIYMSLTRVYRLWNSSMSLLALQMMPERQSNIWRYLQTTYISVFNLLLHKSYTNKQIHRNRRQQLDIYNINTCKLNTLKLTIAIRNLQQYTDRVA
jgi:hypothetical protein